jgi:hypothetical protein
MGEGAARLRAPKVVTTLQASDGETYRLVNTERKTGAGYGMGRFHVVWAEQWKDLVLQVQTLSTAKVFAVLPARLTWSDFARLDQGAIAKECQISAASVSRSLSELERLGAVERQGKGAYTTWRLSLSWGYRGTVAQFAAEREKRQAEAAEREATATQDREIEDGMLTALEAAETEFAAAKRAAASHSGARQRTLSLLRRVPDTLAEVDT